MLLFHNIGFEDPMANLIVIVVFIAVFLVSNYLIFHGLLYFVRNWTEFSRGWKWFFGIMPLFLMLVATIEPFHLAVMSLPFGFFSGFPAVFFFDSRSQLTYTLLGFGGLTLNSIAFIGFIGRIERRIERRRIRRLEPSHANSKR